LNRNLLFPRLDAQTHEALAPASKAQGGLLQERMRRAAPRPPCSRREGPLERLPPWSARILTAGLRKLPPRMASEASSHGESASAEVRLLPGPSGFPRGSGPRGNERSNILRLPGPSDQRVGLCRPLRRHTDFRQVHPPAVFLASRDVEPSENLLHVTALNRLQAELLAELCARAGRRCSVRSKTLRPSQAPQAASWAAPCPCGSGRKYKNCHLSSRVG
jgi:hypothetical protein